MPKNVGLKPVQEKFIALFLQGMKIGEAALQCHIVEETASRWLKNPAVQAEIERRQIAIREIAEQTEQAEITRILTSGYAAIHNRVQDLDRMAHLIEKSWQDPEDSEKIIWQFLSPDKLREWRGCLDDIAKELSQRVKKQEIEHSWAETLDSEYESLVAEMGGLPDASQKQITSETPESAAS